MRLAFSSKHEEMVKQNEVVRDIVMDARESLMNRELEFSDLTYKWDKFMADGLAAGTIAGKNEAARFSSAYEQNPDLYEELSVAKLERDKARGKDELAKILDKSWGRHLRIMGAFDLREEE